MLRILAAVALFFASTAGAGAETFVYVSLLGEKKIAAYSLDPAEGNLTHRADIQTEGEPGALTTDPKQQFLFAAIRSAGNLAAFKIDPVTGKLTHVNTVPAGPDPAHIATDRTGRFLLSAYYVAAKVTVHAIGKDGTLSDKPVQTIMTADKAHAILPDPSNRFVFVPHTGPNAIFQFTFQAEGGKLAANAVPKLTTPDNTGPRHIVFHPAKDLAYVDNEQGGSVTAYALDTKAGTLKALQTISTLPKDFKGTNATAEIKIHPTGKFLYVSNRGHDSIACFKVDGQNGKLSTTGQEPTEKTPRSFDLDRGGKFLLAAGEASGKVAVYKIDADAGTLKRLHSVEVGKQPWWVMAVDLPGRAGADKSDLPPDKEPMTTTRPTPHNEKRHQLHLERVKQGNIDLLFLGDSITKGWNDNEIWKKQYEPLKAANLGIGGDGTENVLWRVQNGELDPKFIKPKVIVLLIGTNNVGSDSTRDIVAGVTLLVRIIRETAPDSKLLLLGIFPCQQRPNKWRRQIEDINAQIARLDDGKMIRFLDLSRKFVNADETISKEVMPDYLHLSEKGYRIWAEGMQPLLAEMMGLPAAGTPPKP